MKIKINSNIFNKKIKLKKPNIRIKIKNKDPMDYEEELNKIFASENKTEEITEKSSKRNR